MIWDNGPAHGGEAVRAYLATPDLALRPLRLPACSPDFPDRNADVAIWARGREEVTANTCPGTKAAVQETLAHFFDASNRTRRVDFARFMVAAIEDDALVREAPAIVGCRSPSALAHAAVGGDRTTAASRTVA